mmetsp:Transcript_4811/g.11750  ORF Transcript_4811/g.11750 Transcript_4811/m.11750 type:complete len:220 (+) Transcript_4811:420-1079(+)
MVVKMLTLAGSKTTSRRSSAIPNLISRGGPGTIPTKSKSPGQGSSSSKSTKISSVNGIAKCVLLDVSVPRSSMSASPVRQIDKLIISPVFTWVTCSSMHAGSPSHSSASAPSSPSPWAAVASAGASATGSAGAGSCAAGSGSICSEAIGCSVLGGAASSTAGTGAGVGSGIALEGDAMCEAGPAGACATGDADVGLAALVSDFLGEGGPCNPEVSSYCR